MTARTDLPSTCDVLVVGAGAVGATAAYETSRRGLSVVVVDAGRSVGHGCSYANAGLLSPSHVEVLATPANVREGLRRFGSPDGPLRVHPRPSMARDLACLAWSARPRRSTLVSHRLQELARASLQMHLDYPAAGVATGIRRTGSLDVHAHPRRPTAASAAAEDAREHEPQLVHPRLAWLHPDDAMLESRTYVRALLGAAAAHGAVVAWDSPVTSMDLRGGRITTVQVGRHRLQPGRVLLATGLGTTKVAAGVGVRVPLVGGRGYVVDLAPVEGYRLQRPVTLRDRRVVATPYADRLRLCGTLELGSDDLTADRRRYDAVLAAGQDELGAAASGKVLQTWSGLRPCSLDGAPVIGASSRIPNLLLATGHGMWGVILAPITAHLLATGIIEHAPTLHDPCLTPDRFDHVGRRRDGTFS